MNLQDEVVLNILSYMDSLNIDIINGNRIKSYSLYLSKIIDISEKRLNNILDVNKKRKIKLDEVSKIAYALNVPLYEFFQN